jgi:hypothetical protein
MKYPKKHPVLVENKITGSEGVAWIINSKIYGSRVVVRTGSNTFDYAPNEFEKVWKLQGQKNPNWGKGYYVYFRGTNNGDWIDAETLYSAKWIFALRNGLHSIAQIAGKSQRKNPISSSLYESFHGMPPKTKRKVHYTNPKGTLIKIGRISEIKYKPEGSTKFLNTEFYHISGDTGEQKLKSNLLLCTDLDGKNIYLVKDKPGKHPFFSERGVIG